MSPLGPMAAVCGAGTCGPEVADLAYDVGLGLARAGAVLICGGKGGVMEAAAKGAKAAGGLTVGILPGRRHSEANPYIDLPLPTGLGEARNVIIVRAAQAIVALPGGAGTLSEVALGLKMGKTVIGLSAWGHIEGVVSAMTPREAVEKALKAV